MAKIEEIEFLDSLVDQAAVIMTAISTWSDKNRCVDRDLIAVSDAARKLCENLRERARVLGVSN